MTRSRRILYGCCVIIFVVFIAELGSFLTMSLLMHQWYSLRDIDAARLRRVEEFASVSIDQPAEDLWYFGNVQTVLHPYLGFSLVPSRDMPSDMNAAPMESFGFFPKTGSIVRTPDADTLIIGIVGGSVAHNFGTGHGMTVLRDALLADPRFSRKRIQVVTMALGGYKAPQSLLALNYFLSLGAHFDIIIDLSGFNEVVLPFRENIPAGLHPLYPRSWQVLAGHLSPKHLAFVGRIAWAREFRADLARWSAQHPCDASYVCSLGWHIADHLLSKDIAAWNARLLLSDTRGEGGDDPVLAGPPYGRSSTGSALTELVDNWKRSAVLMQELGRQHGFHAFTFLQPSPYYAGKPLAPQEMAVLEPGSAFDVYSKRGYPLLQDAVRDLMVSGYNAADLTEIFSHHPEPIYIDACCHMGREGNDILGKSIAGEILRRW